VKKDQGLRKPAKPQKRYVKSLPEYDGPFEFDAKKIIAAIKELRRSGKALKPSTRKSHTSKKRPRNPAK